MPDAVVIGAGPAGIAAARSLLARGCAVRVIERRGAVGGLWRFEHADDGAAAYRTLHLNSSRHRTQFPSYPMPDHWPDYPSHELVASWLQEVADTSGVTERVTFRTAVRSVRPRPGPGEPGTSGWTVTTDTGERIDTDHVVVANGHHGVPLEPELPGHFTGERFHSHRYTDPAVFAGKRVLVVGVGNSGMDLACDAAVVADHVLLSTRHGVHVLPKYAFGRPIDHLSLPISAFVPFALERRLYELTVRLAVGRPQDRGLPEPDHRLLEAHPTVSAQLYDRVGHGDIEVVGDLAALEGDRVRFADGRTAPVDVLVFATGYRVSLPFLDDDVLTVRGNEVPLYQRVVAPDRPGLFFVGFVQTVGANIALMEHQSEWIADLATGRAVLPDTATMHAWIAADRAAMRARYVRSARHTMQVDYWRYIRAIGRERARRRNPLTRPWHRSIAPLRALRGRSG
ncbi:MAG: NAD(P)-binding domain-containing protein [Nitriliruptoraceae bacterium]|nr:NAD(P)-binding domain-containing protein [Nitriliruptoraceae bacterium]